MSPDLNFEQCTPTTSTRDVKRSLFTRSPLHAATAAALKRPPPPEDATLSPTQSSQMDTPISRIDERKVVVGFDTEQWTRLYVFLLGRELDIHSLRRQSNSHHLWLRDHCRCPKCFHPATKQRLFSTFDVCTDCFMPFGMLTR